MKGLLFTFALTFGGAAVALFRPFYGLLVYICFSVVKPEALWPWSVPVGNYSRIVFAGLFIGWIVSGAGNWRLGRAQAPAVLLLGYLAWSMVSAFSATNSELAWSTVEATAKIVIPVFIGLTLIENVRQLRQIAWTVVLSLGYLALEFNLSYYDGTNRLVSMGFAGMEEKTVALMMALGAPMGVFLAIDTKRYLLKAAAGLSTALMIHVPLFTNSRNGMLALVVTAAVALWLIPKKGRHLVVIAAVLLIGLRLAGPQVREQFGTTFAGQEERDASAESRFTLWGQAWETMLEYPIVGLGPRGFGEFAKTRYDWGMAKEAHNTWLQAGAELGVPGLICLACFFVVTVLRILPLARGKRSHASGGEIELARLVVVSLAGFFVTSQFITVYGIETPYHVGLIGAGLLKLNSGVAVVTVPQGLPTAMLSDRKSSLSA